MNKILSILLACTAAGAAYGAQETAQETGQAAKNVAIDSVVVTGARYASDIRHLPMSVAVVDRDEIVRRQEASVLPLLTEQVPGLFVTGRGVMGYGVSDGAAGGISLRGIGGGSAAQMLVLIDGHPQYMGLFGHPIADAYQSMLAERVEVVRGPASVLYGSNAMGGVINIVTRRQREEGVKTDLNVGYGLADRSSQPHPQRPLHERRDRLVQPHGRPPRQHGFRAVRQICQGRLRDQPPLERLRRCEPNTLQRLESGRNHRARLRQRLPHHARHGIRLTGKLVRPDFGRVEVLLQLGPSPDQ